MPKFCFSFLPVEGESVMFFLYQSLPLKGKVASGASRIGYWRYERGREESILAFP